MLKRRVIVCLDVKEGRVTKGVKFLENVDVGDPVSLARQYYEQGADELVFYDITASAEQRSIMLDVVRKVAKNIFIPFSVGGGIHSVQAMDDLLCAGVEKISVNSQAVQHPDIINEGAKKFGNQCIVLGLDAIEERSMPCGYEVVINGGRLKTGKDVLTWACEAVDRGVGEIVLNSIDTDGTREGYEHRITKIISEAVSVPVVASGGAGTPQDLVNVFIEAKADAALVASMLHYGQYSLQEIKKTLLQAGIKTRIN